MIETSYREFFVSFVLNFLNFGAVLCVCVGGGVYCKKLVKCRKDRKLVIERKNDD